MIEKIVSEFSYANLREAFTECCLGNIAPDLIVADPKTYRSILALDKDVAHYRAFHRAYVRMGEFDGEVAEFRLEGKILGRMIINASIHSKA